MMYQLQEESLVKDAIKKASKDVAEKVVGTVYEVKSPVKIVARPAKKPQKITSKPKPTAPILPFRKLPTKLEPNAFDMLAELPPIVIESYLLSMSTRVIINLNDEREARRKKKRKLATFLLLAA